MTLPGKLQCSKEVVGQCGPELTIEPGDSIDWQATFVNRTQDTIEVTVYDDLSWHPFVDTTVVEATYEVGATGSSPTAFPLEDTVTLPPGGKATYDIQSLTKADIDCPVQVTNCMTVIDQADPCNKKFVTAQTVTIVPVGKQASDVPIPATSSGYRDTNLNEIIYRFFVNDECTAHKMTDLISAGFDIDEVLQLVTGGGEVGVAEEVESQSFIIPEVAELSSDADALTISTLDADGNVVATPVSIAETGEVTVSGATTFTEPVAVAEPTTAGQAVSVETYDPATGRIVVAGREVGDTGVRDITSLLINGYTASGKITAERDGDTVLIRGRVIAPGGNEIFLPAIAGFRARPPGGSTTTGGGASNPATYESVRAEIGGASGEAALQPAQPSGTLIDVHFMYFTEEAWPDPLPGTQITPPASLA